MIDLLNYENDHMLHYLAAHSVDNSNWSPPGRVSLYSLKLIQIVCSSPPSTYLGCVFVGLLVLFLVLFPRNRSSSSYLCILLVIISLSFVIYKLLSEVPSLVQHID